VLYPENSVVNYEFSTAYHLPAAWRASATEDEVGNQVLELVPFTTESTTSYPRYYTTLVRIGASADPETLRTCLVATKDQGEIALADREINGTTFKVFSFQNAGMMQYVEGVSYRTIHEEQCIALEKIRVGSSYKEDGVGEGDISEETLNTAYNSLDEIVESFRFAR
ncbi:hypothetical protein KKG57_00575, partial [Patescibacteria group bacterium]|nr:hypothetical protein [Patescibacteria group bacterium]